MSRNFGFTFGRTAEGREKDYAELVKRLEQEKKPVTPVANAPDNTIQNPVSAQNTQFNITNPQDYILLNGKNHGNYSYPDLLVCKYRLADCNEVQNAAKQLGINVANSAKEENGRDYIGKINWNKALSLTFTLGGRTLIPREFEDLLLMLKSGKAVDGVGKPVSKTELEAILNEIMQVREPWRSEWLDADFKYLDSKGNQVSSDKPGNLYINYGHELKNGVLVPKYHEKLETCLMKDKKIKLASMNGQGMAIDEGEDFNFWYPRSDNNSVARFGAGSDGAYLDCDRVADLSNPSLGVRLVVRPKGASAQI